GRGVPAGCLPAGGFPGGGGGGGGAGAKDVPDMGVLSAAGGAAVEPPFRYSPRRGPSHSGGNGARGTSGESTIVIPTRGGRTAMRKVLGAVTAVVFALGVATFIGLPRVSAQGGTGTLQAEVQDNGAPPV